MLQHRCTSSYNPWTIRVPQSGQQLRRARCWICHRRRGPRLCRSSGRSELCPARLLLPRQHGTRYGIPKSPGALLNKGIEAHFKLRKSCIDLAFVGMEEGMEVVDVEVRCALGLGKGKVEEEEGLGRVIKGNPDRGLDLRWRGKDEGYLP